MNEFTQETAETVRSYVYALLDTRRRKSDARRIFYVGKGKGQRCFQHARAAIRCRKASGEPNPKLSLIRQIRRKTGKSPRIEIIRHGLNDDEARLLEAILIKLLRTEGNLTGGRGTEAFCLSTDEVEELYSDPLHESELKSCVLLVNLEGGNTLVPFPKIKKNDLPRRVLRYWRMAREKADPVDYVVGVYRQVIRVVFKVRKNPQGKSVYRRYFDGWTKNRRRNMKTGFIGERCPEKELLWCNRCILNGPVTVTKFARQRGWKLAGEENEEYGHNL